MDLKTATWVDADTESGFSKIYHTYYIELHNGYVLGANEYLEFWRVEEVSNKYRAQRFQFY